MVGLECTIVTLFYHVLSGPQKALKQILMTSPFYRWTKQSLRKLWLL